MAQEVLGTAEARGIAKLWRYKARGDRFCLTGLTGLTTLPSSLSLTGFLGSYRFHRPIG